MRQNYAEPLWFLQATALLVLLVGCANLANVMLARGAAREREIAARAALGASRVQLIRVVLAESIVLSIAGSAIGGWLAHELSTGIVRFLDGRSNLLYLNLALDWRVLAFTSLHRDAHVRAVGTGGRVACRRAYRRRQCCAAPAAGSPTTGRASACGGRWSSRRWRCRSYC